jgi:hypothetical protein
MTYHSGASPAIPTSMSWGAITFTKIAESSGGVSKSSIWIAAFGNSGTNQTNTLTLVGAGGTASEVDVHNYSNVNQATPTSGGIASIATSSTSAISAAMTSTNAFNKIVASSYGQNGTITITNTGATIRVNDNSRKTADFDAAGDATISATSQFSTDITMMGLILNSSNSPQSANIVYSGILNGFTGLTPGAKYYLQASTGVIGTTNTGVLVGVAYSATRLLILVA